MIVPKNISMIIFKMIMLLAMNSTFFASILLAQEDTPSPSVSGDSMVVVGDPGNKPYLRKDYYLWGKPIALGSVDHVYRIGMYEQTVGDWLRLLRAVSSRPDNYGVIDAYGLWREGMQEQWIERRISDDGSEYIYTIRDPAFEKLPITFVSLYDAFYCINWKEHGSPVLEAGADVDAILKHGAYEFIELDEHQRENQSRRTQHSHSS